MGRLSEALAPIKNQGVTGNESISLEFDKYDTMALFGQIDRGVRELGWSMPKAFKNGAWALVNSLKKSTKESPKKRKVYKDLEDERRLKEDLKRNRETAKLGYTPQKVKDQLWAVKSLKGGTKKLLFRAKGKREANKHPFTIISYHKTAQLSWAWGMGALGPRRGFSGGRPAGKRAARSNIEVSSNLRDANPWIRISNKLNYIESALKGGVHSVDTAMERAGRGLMHRIDNELAKRLTK